MTQKSSHPVSLFKLIMKLKFLQYYDLKIDAINNTKANI